MGIEYLARSISLISPDCSEMSERLKTLGSFYLKRSLHPCNSDSLSLALSSWERASQLISGRPVARFQAALKWAEAASPLCPDRLRAYAQAISLIPHIVWLGTSVGRRYKDVLILENVANEAAAAAIHAKNYHLALEWLEQGRSIVWNQMLKLRTSLETLSQADSKLADQFVQVAKELDRAGTFELTSSSFLSETIGLERTGATHRRLAEQYESLLAQVRLIPGFEDFLAPMKASELIRAAQSGPTVMLNVHSSRCDALILLPGCNEIKHVPLPNISQEKVEAIRSDIDAALQSRGIRTAINTRKVTPLRTKQQHQGPEAFENSLAMLWTDVVKPVLDCLGYERQETVETLPHITWCATGVLSSLPLHASGDYAQSGDRLYDFAISSYTPTLAALLVDPPTPGPHSRLLVIGQEHTPGQSPLPETVAELTYIRNKATQEAVCYSQLDGSRATRGAVLEAMGGHDWVHLACHAHQNRKDPTKSGFFLDDGVLSLAEITQRSFNNKGLAFLSACQTAKGDRELPDESVHLASGMLIAGYRSVIATMWSIMDVDAPVMAETVYGQMIIDGKMNHKEAAKALHVATCVLRARVGEKEFARWVPYIHIGQ
ncbi:hypothetical protein OPQ81_009052 [Rhizoctonia solani]|nr:hypothetical protein OPQ81_009052 [Rhizoctonia solani]